MAKSPAKPKVIVTPVESGVEVEAEAVELSPEEITQKAMEEEAIARNAYLKRMEDLLTAATRVNRDRQTTKGQLKKVNTFLIKELIRITGVQPRNWAEEPAHKIVVKDLEESAGVNAGDVR